MALVGPPSASQMEFLAEDEAVTIFPNFKMQQLDFIKGPVGPFHPGVPINVPLWLAIMLKKRKKCKIQSPSWLDLDFLQKTHETKVLGSLPFHYFEIATLLLNNAAEDIRNSTQIRATLEDIWNRRAAKVRDLLLTITPEQYAIQLNNISAMEINKIRPVILKSMDQFSLFAPQADE